MSFFKTVAICNDVRWRRTAIYLSLAVLGCSDNPSAPAQLIVTKNVDVVASGGFVSLSSEQFQQLELTSLLDSTGSVIEGRWANFSITVGEDTATSSLPQGSTIIFRVPALFSGQYSVSIQSADFGSTETTLQVVGAAAPVWHPLSALANPTYMRPFGPGMAIVNDFGFYRFVDMEQMETISHPNISVKPATVDPPGQSFRPGHAVLGFDGLSPGVWDLETMTFVKALSCPEFTFDYAAVETSSGVCISLANRELFRDSQSVIFDLAFSEGRLEMAPNGNWTVPITTPRGTLFDSFSLGWPVLDSLGMPAYSVDRYEAVIGAAFVESGDTLFVLAGTGGNSRSLDVPGRERDWKLEVLLTSTGELVRSVELTPLVRPSAILIDPIYDRLFVAGTNESNRIVLVTLDRHSFEVSSVLHWPDSNFGGSDGGALIHGGSSGKIHFANTLCCDVGGIQMFSFDVTSPSNSYKAP